VATCGSARYSGAKSTFHISFAAGRLWRGWLVRSWRSVLRRLVRESPAMEDSRAPALSMGEKGSIPSSACPIPFSPSPCPNLSRSSSKNPSRHRRISLDLDRFRASSLALDNRASSSRSPLYRWPMGGAWAPHAVCTDAKRHLLPSAAA
jgi:hypothetical protein